MLVTLDEKAIDYAIEVLMQEAFPPGREPYSTEYKEGVAAVLERRLYAASTSCRYPPGTAQADAFRAGEVEGKVIWKHLSEGKRKALAT